MLRIIQNRFLAGVLFYFARTDYFSEGQELAVRCGGKSASGADGIVHRQR
jgi:hypothetical protein